MGSISMGDIFRKQNIDNGFTAITLDGYGGYNTNDMCFHIYDDDEGALSASELHIYVCGIELVRGTHYTRGDLTMNWPNFTGTVTGVGGGITGSATIKYTADLH